MDAAAEIADLRRRLAQAEEALRSNGGIRDSRNQAATRESGEQLPALFDSIDEGFCIIEVTGGEHGKIIDYHFLQTNASFERQTGLVNAVGRSMRELEPDHEEHWFERYSRIAATQTPERFEDRAEALGRWYDVYAFPIGNPDLRRVGILFRDVMKRKRAEQELARSHHLLQTTFDSSLQILQLFKAVRDDQGNIADFEWLLTNKQWNDRWGSNVGKRLLTENPAVVESGVWDMFLEVLETGGPITHEHFYKHEQFDGWFLQTIAKAEDGILLSTLDITDRKRAELGLRDSETRFRQFADASSDVLWIRDAETLAATFVSAAAATVYGATPESLIGDQQYWDSLVVPEDRGAMRRQLIDTKGGDATVAEFRVRRPSDGLFRWIRRTVFPLVDAEGNVQAVAGISSDITETKLLGEHQAVLLAELQHRVRNIMGMIRSMTNRSSEAATSVDSYRSSLEGRLMALSRVQVLLTRQANVGGMLRDVLENEIAAQAQHAGQYLLMGPEIILSPKAVEVLTLAFHELATNAVKYGGLSVPGGRVEVEWQTVERGDVVWLILDWTEHGAPKRNAPERRGFGSELIEMKIPYELRGTGKVTIVDGQAHCHMEIPLRNAESILETDAPTPLSIHGGSLDMTNAPDLSGKTVLVVEDDYYMASDFASALRGAGADVFGPCPSEEATYALLERDTPSSAVLDLNLGGGGPRFEIARQLRERQIPFIFLTGYDPDIIPDDMKDVTRLQKPVPLLEVVEAVSRL